MDNICFDKTTFYTYLFLLGFFVCFTLYVYLHPKINENSDLNLKQELMNEIQKVRAENSVQQRDVGFRSPQPIFLDKIFNPLSGTSPMNPQGSFSTPPYDAYRQFQMLGYISGPNGRYPVMGRYKFNGKSDKFEYYSIDNERGRIKIPFKNKNDNELYDGDSINITELGGEFTFKKYEDQDGNRYSPDIL
jgi:hypothetical protein